jgi:hypothetical protein
MSDKNFTDTILFKIGAPLFGCMLTAFVTFYFTSKNKDSELLKQDHDKLIEVCKDQEFTQKRFEEFIAQFGDLKAVVDDLRFTTKDLQEVVKKLE